MNPIDAYFKIKDLKTDIANLILQRPTKSEDHANLLADEIVEKVLEALKEE